MKITKKLLAIAIVLVLILSLGVSALAADDVTYSTTITYTGAKKGETYSLYKMLDLSVDSQTAPTAYRYTVNSAWSGFFGTGGAGAAYVTIDATDGHITWNTNKQTDADLIAFAQAAAAYAAANNITAVESITPSADGDITFPSSGTLANGYYLITSTLGTKAVVGTSPIASSPQVGEKNALDTITKLVKEDSTGTFGAANDAQIGDEVEFKSTVTLVPYTRNVKIHDVMDDGLTFVTGSIAIQAGDSALAAANYEVQATPDTGDTFTIQIKDTYLAGLTAETTLTVTYKAKLNKSVVGTENNSTVLVDQENETWLTFGKAQETTHATTTTSTHSVVIYKHAANKTDNLAGAIFQLLKGDSTDPIKLYKISDTEYRIADATETGTASSHKGDNGAVNTIANGTLVTDFISVATGKITIYGLDSDNDYKLKEIQAPEGYNLPTSTFALTFSNNSFAEADIANQAGMVLPSTGGIGTTMFYIIGGIFAIGAAVVLIAKKRVSE